VPNQLDFPTPILEFKIPLPPANGFQEQDWELKKLFIGPLVSGTLAQMENTLSIFKLLVNSLST
jgi:hypothetical protein